MTMQIGLREANQHLAQYIHSVEQGEEIIITRRGKAVARLIPEPTKRVLTKHQQEIKKQMMTALRRGSNFKAFKIDREEIYDRSKNNF